VLVGEGAARAARQRMSCISATAMVAGSLALPGSPDDALERIGAVTACVIQLDAQLLAGLWGPAANSTRHGRPRQPPGDTWRGEVLDWRAHGRHRLSTTCGAVIYVSGVADGRVGVYPTTDRCRELGVKAESWDA